MHCTTRVQPTPWLSSLNELVGQAAEKSASLKELPKEVCKKEELKSSFSLILYTKSQGKLACISCELMTSVWKEEKNIKMNK